MKSGADSHRPPWAPKKPILVIGDLCTDVTIRAGAVRLSRERPLPVFSFESAESAGGGAGNVYRQLMAYEIEVMPVVLARALKVRVVAGSPEQEVLRLDWPWQMTEARRVACEMARATGDLYSAAVYVDYRGLAGPDAEVRDWLRALSCPLVADARSSLRGWDGFDVLKINALDAGLEALTAGRLERARRDSGATYLVVTRGAAGHMTVGPTGRQRVKAIHDGRPIVNVSGAGDVFTATLAACFGYMQERWKIIRAPEVEDSAVTAGQAAGLRIRRPGYNEAVTYGEISRWLRRSRTSARTS